MRFRLGFGFALILGYTASAVVAQAPLVVDVHASPYRNSITYATNFSPQRFDMRNATVLDMVEFAYALGEQDDDRENAAIVGGPAWIDYDRFDVMVKVAATKPSEEQARAAIKRVLAERFGLKYHRADQALPGFVVTVAKEGLRAPEVKNAAAESECQEAQSKANPEQYTETCTAMTVAQFVETLAEDFPHSIIDRTGVTKRYDFTLKLSLGPEVHTRDDRARIYTVAMEKQLGLVVTRGQLPKPAFVVDAVERSPSANAAGVADEIPELPDLEFEVASIRPAAETEAHSEIRPTGSQLTFSSMQLSELIARAWQLPTAKMLGDALAKLPQTRWTILVKLPAGMDAGAVYQNADQISSMLQKMVMERFAVKYHWGEWTQPDAYVLLAGSPKMKKANANERSVCKYGPAEGEKTARFAGSAFDGEFHCQNVTMAQFADKVQALAKSEVKNRVADKTGLAGAYDFTVVYTNAKLLRTQTAPGADAAVMGLSLEEAFRRQLGLRLEKQPLVLPAVILDHFEQTPSEN